MKERSEKGRRGARSGRVNAARIGVKEGVKEGSGERRDERVTGREGKGR